MVSLETYAKFPLAHTFEVHRQAFVGGAKVRARRICERRKSILRADEHSPYSNTEILLQFVQAITEDATRDASVLAQIRPDGSVLQVSESNGDIHDDLNSTCNARQLQAMRKGIVE
jgi:hypothetical protein